MIANWDGKTRPRGAADPHRTPIQRTQCGRRPKRERSEQGENRRQSPEALCRTRTDDPFLTMEVLYQLS